jgi:hypothetical protein
LSGAKYRQKIISSAARCKPERISFAFYDGRKIKCAESFQRFRIELFSSSAIQTASISGFSLRERAAQVFVPAAEKLCDQTGFFPEYKRIELPRFSSVSVNQALKFVYQQYIRHKFVNPPLMSLCK